MNWLIVKNDLKRNKVINLILLLFIMLSATLAAVSVIMSVQTFTSINNLYEKALPPHFVQMHKGEYDQTKIDDFMKDYDGVIHYQTDIMIDVYGQSITVKGKKTFDLSDCRLDIGLVKQNDDKDLLLDLNHKKVILNNGEIGIPVILKEMYDISLNDKIILTDNGVTKEFVVKEFVLDSMMNSTMASSTRILLSDNDYDNLFNKVGEKEYLIEVYFSDKSLANSFQTAYENRGLPQNGQAINYTIIFLLSALTDIVMVFVFLVVSILLIIISFICVKFTLLAALEEEISEVGSMKAIGLSFKDIRSIYLNKYKALACIGALLGFVLAILINKLFTNHINDTFGNIGLSFLSIILSVIVSFLVYLLIVFYSKKVLKKLKKVTVVDALVRRIGIGKDSKGIKDGLYKSKKLPINITLGLREVFYKFRNWLIVFLVVLISTMIILIPINLLNTFNSPKFITYMGSSLEDILIEVENGEALSINHQKVKDILINDKDISNFFEYRRVIVQTTDVDNELVNIHVDSGSNSGNELQYLEGKSPNAENEIAISFLNSEKIGKKAGEKIKLIYLDSEHEFIISGIYQDVTSGGFTAKSKNNFTGLASIKYTFSVNLKDKAKVIEKVEEWISAVGTGITIDPMKDFINQTLGGVASQLSSIVIAIVIIGLSLAMLISVLFLKLRLAKDLTQIASLKAIGFSLSDIKLQYMIKIGLVSVLGVLGGVLFTQLFGSAIVNLAIGAASLGITKVDLIPNVLIGYLICPLILIILILLVSRLVLNTINKYNIISIIKE